MTGRMDRAARVLVLAAALRNDISRDASRQKRRHQDEERGSHTRWPASAGLRRKDRQQCARKAAMSASTSSGFLSVATA